MTVSADVRNSDGAEGISDKHARWTKGGKAVSSERGNGYNARNGDRPVCTTPVATIAAYHRPVIAPARTIG